MWKPDAWKVEPCIWVSTRGFHPGFHWHGKISNVKKPDETGPFSIDAIGVMYEWRGGTWKLGPQIGTLTLAGCCAEHPRYANFGGRTREFNWLVASEELVSGHIDELPITELLFASMTHVNRQFQVSRTFL